MKTDNTEEIGKLAAALSLIEIGLGSFLHSFKIPLSGHSLSINQIAFLSRSSFKLNTKKSALQISLIATLLKSLSPAGKKLTPMLAISAQGVFFYLGLFLFGINYLGLLLAVFLSSLWAFVQPVFFIYLIFGKTSTTVAEYFLREFEKIIPNVSDHLFGIIIGLILLKFILAFVISLVAIKVSDHNFDKYHQTMLLEIKTVTPSAGHSAIYLAIRDLLNPLFLISFFMTILFFIFSHSSESNIQIIWIILRPLPLGFILFYTIRIYPVKNLSKFLHRKGLNQVGKILDIAIKIVHETGGL